jgi:uncharacterized protein YlaI
MATILSDYFVSFMKQNDVQSQTLKLVTIRTFICSVCPSPVKGHDMQRAQSGPNSTEGMIVNK